MTFYDLEYTLVKEFFRDKLECVAETPHLARKHVWSTTERYFNYYWITFDNDNTEPFFWGGMNKNKQCFLWYFVREGEPK